MNRRRLAGWLAALASLPAAAIAADTGAAARTEASTALAAIADRAGVERAVARGALVWDVRDAPDFVRGHLPGAISIGDAVFALRDGSGGGFLPAAGIEPLLASAGLDPSREIVVYGNRGSWQPYVARHALERVGARRVSVYDGGVEDWLAAGLALEDGPPRLRPAPVSLREPALRSIGTGEMLSRLNQPWAQLVDVRPAAEYRGDEARALRGGRIPGAVNVPHAHNRLGGPAGDAPAGPLRPIDELRALYAALDPRKETIVYDHDGTWAAQTAAVLQSLGFRNVRVYDASWRGWSAAPDVPVDAARFVDVGALGATISGLQSRVDALERELSAARAPRAGLAPSPR